MQDIGRSNVKTMGVGQHSQRRSQGLSTSRIPRKGGRMRDPGNEVAALAGNSVVLPSDVIDFI